MRVGVALSGWLALVLAAGCERRDSTGEMDETKEPLETWSRPHYEPGGGEAFLFYVIYGTIDTGATLSRVDYRCDEIPEGLEIMTYGPSVHPEVVASFREGYLWEQLRASDSELAVSIADQDSCMVLRGTFPDPGTLNYLRNTIGLVTHFLDHGGVAVYDPQMFQWWSPGLWKERIFEPASSAPEHHVVILTSEDEGGTEWIHTRGLRKFGRPDLSIPQVPVSLRPGAIELCERFIRFQAFGGVIEEGREIRMDSFPAGFICRHAGEIDDPDFNNVHVRIARDQAGAEGPEGKRD